MSLNKRQRILVVDDEALVRDTVAEYLAEAGYQSVIAASWKTGGSNFEGIGYSLVVTDIFMPDQSGLDIIHEIRTRWPNVKILAISGGWSGMTSEDAIRAAGKIGADASMEKPLDFPALLAQVQSLIGGPFVEEANQVSAA